MNNSRVFRWIIAAICILCAVVFLCTALSYTPTFQGNRVKNPDSYQLEIQKMNGTDSHTMELEKEDSLHIRLETDRGTLSLEIKGPDGTMIYQGNGTAATDFTLNIPDSGIYSIQVDAKNARGILHIRAEKAEHP